MVHRKSLDEILLDHRFVSQEWLSSSKIFLRAMGLKLQHRHTLFVCHFTKTHISLSHRTFSPVPRRVMDGSEPGDTTPAAVLSGAPIDLQARTVRIYRPSKTATQSGTWHQHLWRMDWDVLSKGHRWENPLMGWQSSSDAMQGTHMNFRNKEEAIMFAQKQGYEYFVQEPNERRVVPKAYANNFVYDKGIRSKGQDVIGDMRIKHVKTK